MNIVQANPENLNFCFFPKKHPVSIGSAVKLQDPFHCTYPCVIQNTIWDMVSNCETNTSESVVMVPKLDSTSIIQLPVSEKSFLNAEIVQNPKKRKLTISIQSEPKDPQFEEALSIIKRNMVKIETESQVQIKSEKEDGATITNLRIRALDELQSDSEDESGEERSTSLSPVISLIGSQPVKPVNSLLGSLITRPLDFGPGVYLPYAKPLQLPTVNYSMAQQLCFHCKCYGHSRVNCQNQWYHWWPKEFLEKNPWLYAKVRKLRSLKNLEYWNFRRFHEHLEDEAADKEWNDLRNRKMPKVSSTSINKPKTLVNRFETQFPKAIRRLHSRSINKCNPKSKIEVNEDKTSKGPADFGKAIDIFERLQTQIEELKNSLDQLKMHQL